MDTLRSDWRVPNVYERLLELPMLHTSACIVSAHLIQQADITLSNPASCLPFWERPLFKGKQKGKPTQMPSGHGLKRASCFGWFRHIAQDPTPPPQIGVSGAHIPAEAKNQAFPLRGGAKSDFYPRGSMWSLAKFVTWQILCWLVEFKREPVPKNGNYTSIDPS